MMFTCNYCGETVHGETYVEHIEEHSDTTDSIVDTRYRPSDLEEARAQTRDAYNEFRNY